MRAVSSQYEKFAESLQHFKSDGKISIDFKLEQVK
jgi:hypothetical protein